MPLTRRFGRRALLRATSALAALALPARLPADTRAPAEGRYQFEVSLGRSVIGRQRLEVSHDGDTLVLRHHRTLRVMLLFFEAYSEQHDSEEHWRDGRLLRLRSRSVESGERQEVDGEATGDGFALRYRVEGETPGALLLPADVGTTNTFWTTQTLQRGQLVDSTDGDRLHASFGLRGEEHVDGRPVHRFALSAGDTEADVWFADGVMWRARFRHDGHEVDYRRDPDAALA